MYFQVKCNQLATKLEKCQPTEANKTELPTNIAAYNALDKTMTHFNIVSKDDLQFHRQVGKGSLSTVHLATMSRFNINVAVKTPKDIKDKRNLREAKVLQSIDGHKNFPFVFGVTSDNDLVLEFVGKGDIAMCLSSCVTVKSITNQHWTHIIKELTEAVGYLHTKGILHNDIKEDNVLIDLNGTWPIAKLSDFGKATLISKPIAFNLTEEQQVQYATHCRHIAPELYSIQGGTQSQATDTYSLGRMLYSLTNFKKMDRIMKMTAMCRQLDVAKRWTIPQLSHELNKIKYMY